VLKKAGIVVATAAAGMLAVSPLAFAGDDDGDKKIKVDKASNEASTGGEGFINIQDNNIANCLVDDVEVLDQVSGLLNLGLLGGVESTNEEKAKMTYDSCSSDSSDNIDQENEDD
jgi:hypothetical protein